MTCGNQKESEHSDRRSVPSLELSRKRSERSVYKEKKAFNVEG